MTTDKEELRKEFENHQDSKEYLPGYQRDNAIFDWLLSKLEAKDKEIEELKDKVHFVERIRMEDAWSAINEANGLRQQITDLKAEIERYKELILNFKNGLSMTYEQSKDQIAKKYGYKDWESIDWYQVDYSLQDSETKSHAQDLLTKEAAELYADSVARDAWDRACEAQRNQVKLNIPIWVKDSRTYKEFIEMSLPEYQPK